MARPVSLCDNVRLHIYGPDLTTSRGTVSADGASWHHSKDVDGSSLTFTAPSLDALLASDPTLFDEAYAVPEWYIGGSWVARGTPYMLAQGPGTVFGPDERADEEVVPSGVGALEGLAGQCLVLPRDPDPTSVTFRYSGGLEQNRYLGWMSIGYDETGDDWHDVDVYDPTGHPKEDKPPGWGADSSAWIFRDTDEGGLTLFRIGTFTIADDTRVHIASSSDENHKVYLDGPNTGCCVIDFFGDEDAYNDEPGYWSRRLMAGTYRVSEEMRTVDSPGGDGNDSTRVVVWYFGGADRTTPSVILESSADARVRRQPVTDERPGYTVGKLLRLLLEDNVTLDADSPAQLLLDAATFTDDVDTDGNPWSDGKEWVWPLGTPLSSVLMDLQEDADFDMGPDFSFNAWDDRGTDLSSAVPLVPGGSTPDATMNIEQETYESDPPGMNGALTLSQDGFDVRLATLGAGEPRRLGFLDLGAAPSIGRARKLANAAIRQSRTARRHYTYNVMIVTGAVPYDDFDLCDRISGRDYTKTPAVQETTGFGVSVGDKVTFTVEAGEV